MIMQKLRIHVDACGLKINKQETERVSDFNAFVADHIHKNYKTIARYIFTQEMCENFESKMQEDSPFMKNAVEEIFYSLRDDLRWNLYLVCVMDDSEFEKLSSNEKLNFHSNKDFTRNIVIPISKLEEEIPVGIAFPIDIVCKT